MVRFHGAGYLGESIGCRTYLESLTRVSRASGETRVRARDVRARAAGRARGEREAVYTRAAPVALAVCAHTARNTLILSTYDVPVLIIAPPGTV